MRVGIYSPNWVGDAVMSLPFINRCRKSFPEDEITVVARSWVSSVFQNHPHVSRIQVLGEDELRGAVRTTRTGLRLRELDLDDFYLLTDSLRSAWLARLSGAGRRVGFATQGRSSLLTSAVDHSSTPTHRSDEYLRLLDVEDGTVRREISGSDVGAGGIRITREERDWAEGELSRLRLTEPVAVFPWSVAESRRVPVDKWEEIFLEGVERNHELLILGDSAAAELSDTLVERLDRGTVMSVCGRYDLRQSMALLSRCAGAVGTDTGMGHVAANLGLKTVTLFGAGDPSRTAPVGSKTAVVTENVYCSPCRKNVCINSEEPLICLKSIHASEVWDSYLSL